MKKTLCAALMLAAFAGTAAAESSVTLYGMIDTGLQYQHQKITGQDSVNTFSMETSNNETSVWGLTGTEEIGNAEVTFVLENSFNSDDGTKADDRLFDQEASITVSGAYGALSAGRLGALSAATGTYDQVFAVGESFDGGDGENFGLAAAPILDNTVAYQTPDFYGFKATLMYSFNGDSSNKLTENTSQVDRYYGAAVNYENGPLQAVLSYEFLNRASAGANASDITEDGQLVNLGVNYNIEDVAQVFVMGQYFKGWDDGVANAGDIDLDVAGKGLKGWGAHVGAIVPAFGGDVTAGLYYADADADTAGTDVKFYGAGVRYVYPLSKRTSLYAGARYSQTKGEEVKAQTTTVYTGISHSF